MKSTIEESMQIVQDWEASGLSRDEFAALKGLTFNQLRYHISRVRKLSSEELWMSSVDKIEFAPVPHEQLNCSSYMFTAGEVADQPSLLFQSGAGCLQATNRIDPHLLKVAMEVMLSC